ncbi:CynX/NimT family MFS transporter [Flavobacterium kingsejongi]|uniref:MFS transporter n=1 Tax=Flavobacterium kingsejongi TaxID=1678728 RepID=A0A2S1LRI3_9FLAO|nr:MFS transporter [Flavobacterium kingsejongi]AWG26380.1 MFS transporter [Flavobacterium kingsejongi]
MKSTKVASDSLLPNKIKIILSFLGVVLIAANLRAPLTAVGPVLNEIRNALDLSITAAGFLTTIPLFVFACFSILIPKLTQYYTIERILFCALLLLSLGLYTRISGTTTSLFIGSAIVGCAICIGNVLIPAFIKKDFPNATGVMMGIYAVSMNLTAALASGFSISIGKTTTYGWKGSLGIWMAVAIVALVLWSPLVFQKKEIKMGTAEPKPMSKSILQSKLAWQISLFMGLQSLMYYCLVAWLPIVLQEWGMPNEDSGWILSYIQMAMLPVTFAGPIIANKMANQKVLVLLVSAAMALSILLLIVFKTDYIYLAAILFGMASGLAFSLSMMFFVLRTKQNETVAKISGMAQSIGYFLAAFGPPIFGKLYELNHNWNYSFYFMFGLLFLMLYVGIQAARNKYID